MKKPNSLILSAVLAAFSMVGAAQANDTVKIGFITTLTTPAAVIGEDMVDAVNLALEHIDHEMAGKEVEVIFEDDGFKPGIGKQKADKLVKQDDVTFVAGIIWSNVLLASQKTVLDAGKFLISSNAGASDMAGKLCHKNFFSASWQNDQTPMAMGEVLNQLGVKSLYVMSPNYKAGQNMVAGVERIFDGEVLGKDMTKWPEQLDFQTELAKARASGAEAIFVFYPGKAGVAFINQYQQAGLGDVMPLYTVFTVDSLSLPKFQEANLPAVLGSRNTMFWSPDLDTPQNNRFVSAFKEKYGSYPSHYAAQSYDTIFLIKSAVEAVDGNLEDMDGMRAAMEKANFPSVRGEFTYGPNHIPIQDFYLREVVEDEDGVWTLNMVKKVYEDHQDPYVDECDM